MKKMICIVCPKGCRLHVAQDGTVTGNACPRGAAYGRAELQNPVRTLTSTVRIEGAALRRVPVKTAAPIPKGSLFAAMEALNALTLYAPVRTGEIVLENIAGTGVNLVVTRTMEQEK